MSILEGAVLFGIFTDVKKWPSKIKLPVSRGFHF